MSLNICKVETASFFLNFLYNYEEPAYFAIQSALIVSVSTARLADSCTQRLTKVQQGISYKFSQNFHKLLSCFFDIFQS